jgi:hypothetical protein
LTAAVVWLAGESRTAEPANTGMAATLKEGMHFEQNPKKLPET